MQNLKVGVINEDRVYLFRPFYHNMSGYLHCFDNPPSCCQRYMTTLFVWFLNKDDYCVICIYFEIANRSGLFFIKSYSWRISSPRQPRHSSWCWSWASTWSALPVPPASPLAGRPPPRGKLKWGGIWNAHLHRLLNICCGFAPYHEPCQGASCSHASSGS